MDNLDSSQRLVRLRELYSLKRQLHQALARPPQVKEWAQAAQCSPESLILAVASGLAEQRRRSNGEPGKTLSDRIVRAFRVLKVLQGRPPSLEDIAEHMGISTEQIHQAFNYEILSKSVL